MTKIFEVMIQVEHLVNDSVPASMISTLTLTYKRSPSSVEITYLSELFRWSSKICDWN